MLNSTANITIENCSGDYNDEIEPDGNRTLHKGVHGGSGGPGSATGIEDDLINVIGACFYDLFTSDTTGFVGLVFNDKGNFHAGCNDNIRHSILQWSWRPCNEHHRGSDSI